jgi:hypothetical protein
LRSGRGIAVPAADAPAARNEGDRIPAGQCGILYAYLNEIREDKEHYL